MGRIMAIDYGQKRVGLAVTDEFQIIATALDTVPVKDIFTYLDHYFSKEQVECVVVGEPRQMDYTVSEAARFIDPFVKKFGKLYQHIKLERYDERFTSRMAQQAMLDGGLRKKDRQNKATVDKVSAVILLQSYLSARNIKSNRS